MNTGLNSSPIYEEIPESLDPAQGDDGYLVPWLERGAEGRSKAIVRDLATLITPEGVQVSIITGSLETQKVSEWEP